MEIKKVISDKKEFLELLLLADEQESMIDRYLERGDMFVLYDNGLKACCVVTREGEGIYEIKNIATISFFQRQGYGKRLIQFLFDHYRGKCSEMLVGTGDAPSTLSFYEHCGFTISHRLKNFFTDNYDHPMYEDGKQLVDMVYLKKTFSICFVMEMDINRLVKEYGSYQKRFRLSDCVDEIIELYVYITNRRTHNIDSFFI